MVVCVSYVMSVDPGTHDPSLSGSAEPGMHDLGL